MYTIQTTSYIVEGYALMDFMMFGVAALMSCTNWPRETAGATAMAFTVAIALLFAYLQLLCVFLEDPFNYPAGYARRCYKAGRRVEMGLWEDHFCNGSIDMSPLMVVFGRSLRDRLRVEGLDPDEDSDETVLEEARNKEGGAAAAVASASAGGPGVYLLQRGRLVLQARDASAIACADRMTKRWLRCCKTRCGGWGRLHRWWAAWWACASRCGSGRGRAGGCPPQSSSGSWAW
jgi:hypothetical protein